MRQTLYLPCFLFSACYNHVRNRTIMKKREYSKYINYTTNQIAQTYHQFDTYLGISDSVSDILYVLEQEGGNCEQRILYKNTMTSRKTISSALQKMHKEGYLTITPKNGRENFVSLTEKGQELLKNTGAKITMAENRVYAEWSEEELKLFYELSQRFLKGLNEELRKMKEEKK